MYDQDFHLGDIYNNCSCILNIQNLKLEYTIDDILAQFFFFFFLLVCKRKDQIFATNKLYIIHNSIMFSCQVISFLFFCSIVVYLFGCFQVIFMKYLKLFLDFIFFILCWDMLFHGLLLRLSKYVLVIQIYKQVLLIGCDVILLIRWYYINGLLILY